MTNDENEPVGIYSKQRPCSDRRRLYLWGVAGALLAAILCVGVIASAVVYKWFFSNDAPAADETAIMTIALSSPTTTLTPPIMSTATAVSTPTPLPPEPTLTLTASATPAPTPTPSPTKSPTPAPIPTLNALYRIGIAEFAGEGAAAGIAAQIREDLQAALQDYDLAPMVALAPASQTVKTAEEAQTLAANEGDDLLIWGESDAVDVYLHVLAPQESYGLESAWHRYVYDPSFVLLDEIVVSTYGDVAFHAKPANNLDTQSLSLFTIGQLQAFSGNAEAAKFIFKEALDATPNASLFADEATQHFFNAYTSPDGETQICEYAQAIQRNPNFSEAYNNLSLLLTSLAEEHPLYLHLPCIEEAGITPFNLLERAAQTRPGWATPLCNLAASHWNEATESLSIELPTLRYDFDQVIRVNPNLPIVRVAAGDLAVWDGDYAAAVAHFSAARDLWPASLEVMVNLGHALTLAGRENEAKAVYEGVLSQLSFKTYGEQDKAGAWLEKNLYLRASIPLIDLYQKTGDFDKARELHKDAVHFLQQSKFKTCAFPIGLAKYYIHQRDWQGAQDYLAGVDCYSESLFVYEYILELVKALQEPSAAPQEGLWQHGGCGGHPLDTMESDYVSQIATCKLLEDCHLNPRGRFTMADLDGAGCLPADNEARLIKLYDYFMQAHLQNLYLKRKPLRYYPHACPYVFTYDAQRQHWVFDTTILYQLNSPEKEQYQLRSLHFFDGRLRLREVEPETSYIDHLYIRFQDDAGAWHTLYPDDPLLSAKDGQYLILEQGADHSVTFALPLETPIQNPWVVAYGYYVPYGLKE
ncbi:MAG: tetratricopeptide repeat protein [Anaerolineae bacterium]|nr:tetratricopeptide repeat protein [Anaerolineae bacterium]